MKVNVEFPVADGEGRRGSLKFQAELSGDLVKELELYDGVAIERWYGMIINKIKED